MNQIRVLLLKYVNLLFEYCHVYSFVKIKRDSKMSFSDKISWIGGMMGLFTGFSVISGLEIMYWLWFKVLLHAHEVEPVDEDLQQKVDGLKNELGENEKKINNLEMELQEIKMKLKGGQSGDPKAGAFFDAIFVDPEAKESN